MGAEDFIDLHDSDSDNENSELPNSNPDLAKANSQPSSSQVKEDNFNSVDFGRADGDGGNDCMQEIELDKDLIYKSSILVDNTGLSEMDTMAEKMATVKSEVNSENGYPTQNESTTDKYKIDGSPIAGVKRARTTYVDQQPVVHVIYNSLTRDSKKKLEELLQKWSEWHAQHGSLSNDSEEVLESGEETYFPAIPVGLEKSTVSFWMDNQTKKQQSKEFIPLDDNSVPLYDRGYGVGLTSIDGSTNVERGLETLEASRCFNCGSYNHSLKECPKPRDNVAVNNARKQHSSKRNQSNGPRNSTRYYQDSPGGKYDGLKPGVLSTETRKLLGLGELDPPPWLNRMREIGYPPGYLDPDEEDQPSGITIYADEETNKTQHQEEDGEILEKDDPDPQKKMSVEFPGINAPIPENADGKRWATSNETSFDSSGNRSHYRSSRSSGQQHRDHIRSRDYRDDGSPREPGIGSSHMPLYSGYNPIGNESHSPRNYAPIPRSPNLGRSLSDRVRWSPLAHEGSPNHSPYNSFPYTSPNAQHSPQSYGSPSFENWAPHNLTPDLSSHRKDRHDRDRDRHHHHHRNRN